MNPDVCNETVQQVLNDHRVAVFIVAYNAEKHIEDVLKRIPNWVASKLAEIYIIDDSSSDRTFEVASALSKETFPQLNIYKTPYNQGYGGNQILGYQHAIEKGHDIVVLLHGDGQYAPEELPRLLEPYAKSDVGAVFGSRFLNHRGALDGGMPKYKYFGNRILTWVQNRLLGSRLSEMHSGYRSYRMSCLKKVPFTFNSKGFDFDADIIIQLIESGMNIHEVPIPTYYGDEICHVNGLQYAWRCVRACVINLLMKVEIFYDPKFDLSHLNEQQRYTRKSSTRSLHHYVRNFPFEEVKSILDLGGGDGQAVSLDLAKRSFHVTVLDQSEGPKEPIEGLSHVRCDLDQPWASSLQDSYDACLALDVIEHLKSPENGLQQIFHTVSKHGTVILSTGNIAFLPIRIMLLLGAFNYGRKGILDLTHKRLFTRKSFRRLVQNHGFEIVESKGFGVPLKDLAPNAPFAKTLEFFSHCLAQLWPSLFAYQLLLTCRRPLAHQELMVATFNVHHDDGSSKSQ